MPRPFVPGDRVLLIDSKNRRHLVNLAEGGQFHSHAGVLEHDEIIGREEGISVRSSLGARLVVLRPSWTAAAVTAAPAGRRDPR